MRLLGSTVRLRIMMMKMKKKKKKEDDDDDDMIMIMINPSCPSTNWNQMRQLLRCGGGAMAWARAPWASGSI